MAKGNQGQSTGNEGQNDNATDVLHTTKQSTPADIHNPFVLHSGDHPSLILVSHVLTGPNYNTWSRVMKMALNAKNRLGFIDNTLKQPAVDDPNANVWSRCNSMVTSWLLNAVSKEIADSLLYLGSAKDVWDDLHDHFKQSNVPKIYRSRKI